MVDGELRPTPRCSAIGATAHQLGREAVVAPSAAGSGLTLALFVERLGSESRCDLVETRGWLPQSSQRE